MNPDYEYTIEYGIPMKNQKMMDITKAILSIFYRDYWANPEQRKLIMEKEKLGRRLIEKEKREKYGTEIKFKTTKKEVVTQNDMIVYKENIVKRFLSKIFSMLKNIKK